MRISDWSSDVCSSDLCGRNQGARVAVDVDALRVTALEARGAVGIHDRQEVQGGAFAQALHQRVVGMFAEEAEQVGDRHRRGALVAVHLRPQRSEEHTSELQSLLRSSYAVFCLKKKTTTYTS